MQRFLIISGILASAALYALTLSTTSQSRLNEYFWYIVLACAVLGACMFGVITRYVWLVFKDKKHRIFGSRIARRLSLTFTLVATLPALLLLGVAAQFISHSISSWFGNDTKEALERSLKLSQTALDGSVRQSSAQALLVRANVQTLAAQQRDVGEAFRTEQARPFSHLAVWDVQQQPKLLTERNPRQLRSPVLDESALQKLRTENSVQFVENLNNTLYAGGWQVINDDSGRQYALFFRQLIPENIAKDAQLIEAARARYAELLFAQKSLQTFFLITLFIAATLAILLALAAALYFSRRFVEPILLLGNGARAVAQGDFSHRIEVVENDELGRLTELFNHMTEELASARDADELHRAEQDAARHYLERVLESLSAGVVTLNSAGSINTFNKSAEQILGIALGGLVGKLPQVWARYSPQHAVLARTFFAMLATEHRETPEEIAYAGADESRILLGKAIRLPAENGRGIVLVFDDITLLAHAQKDAAWGEVARRLAHEIRNPLTPIQLSAERLAHRLHRKLDAADAQVLTKSTDTIIKQVAALKEMVEAFRNYARAPSLKLEQVDFNDLVGEMLILYETNPCQFNAKLSNIPLLLKADSTAMRQVLHNLFRNAAEAAAADVQPLVRLHTWQKDRQIGLTICNNGKSFSEEMLKNAFEPYITDKPTGTGLGLAVVKKIIEEHGGRVLLGNQSIGGACVRLEFPMMTNQQENS